MPLKPEFQSEELTDSVFAFPQGMNAGIPPILLPRTQLAFLTNGTVRGDFAVHRPAFRKMNLSFTDSISQSHFQTAKFQGAGMFNPIAAADCLMCSVGGNIFQITPTPGSPNALIIQNNPFDGGNPPDPDQVWIFQTERWAIINDGVSIPIIADGITTRRSDTGGFFIQVMNVSDPNAGATYPVGTKVLLPTTQAGSLYVGSTCTGPTTGTFGPNTSYNFPGGLAVGSNVTLTYTGPNPTSADVIIGNDLWKVGAAGTTWFPYAFDFPHHPGPFCPTLSDGFPAHSNPNFVGTTETVVAGGTNYAGGTPIVNTAPAQTVGVTGFTVPAIGFSKPIQISQPYNLPLPGTIFINGQLYHVTAINVGPPSSVLPELPPARMGCNAGGRTWLCLPDGKSYIASDLTGDQSSGTVQFQFTDAVLHFSENTLIAGGGAFRVPSNAGNISAMIPTATMDSSLGTGPVEIFTPTMVFANNSPADRSTWQNITYVIQSVSLLGAGGLSQWSTVNANSDTMFRSLDGIRSLVLARRDFDVWGNVPYSEEVEPIIVSDNPNLLQFSSAAIFDNRMLMTANPQQHAQGVYHDRIIALNFDPVSSLAGKASSVYDGIWTGLNVLQLVTGTFNNIWRCFAFVLNLSGTTPVIELWEILLQPPDPDFLPIDQLSQWSDPVNNFDSGTEPIPMSITFPLLDFGQKDPKNLKYLRLDNGEIYVDHMTGTVEFQLWYKPDDYPFWTLWFQWTETAQATPQGFPQFRSRMGVGTPSGDFCDPSNNRPLREGYRFQLKLIIIGNARFKGGKFSAVTIPQPKYAPPCPLSRTGFGGGIGQEDIGQTGLASINPQILRGPPGPPGGPGPRGPAGPGVAPGGTAGQVLAKIDNVDFNTQWVNQSGGGGGANVLEVQVMS